MEHPSFLKPICQEYDNDSWHECFCVQKIFTGIKVKQHVYIRTYVQMYYILFSLRSWYEYLYVNWLCPWYVYIAGFC